MKAKFRPHPSALAIVLLALALDDETRSKMPEIDPLASPPTTLSDIAPRPLNPALPPEEARPPQPALPPLPPRAPEPLPPP